MLYRETYMFVYLLHISHITPFFLPVSVQHNQRPWRVFNPIIREIQAV